MVHIIYKEEVYAVTPNSTRAELAEDLRNEIVKYNKNCRAFDEYEEAYLEALKNSKKNDIILASGSLYMIGDMRKIINKL